MLSATLLSANLVTDMPTNPANLVTDMAANPTVVHLHAKCRLSATLLSANLVTDMPTKPANLVIHCLQTLQFFTCMQKCNLSATLLNANLATHMPTNPTVVHLHAKMHAFCNNTQCKPCDRHAYKSYQLCTQFFTCMHKCKLSATLLNANLATYMPTNPTVVHLHAKMHAFCNSTQCKTCLQTLQLFNCA